MTFQYDKAKRWQFSLNRMLWAMTWLCTAIAVPPVFYSWGDRFVAVVAFAAFLGAAVGVFVGGSRAGCLLAVVTPIVLIPPVWIVLLVLTF